MKAAAEILNELHAAGIRCELAGERVALTGNLRPDLIERARAVKADILAELRRAQFVAIEGENAREYVAERSAICGADGLPPAMLRGVFTCTLRDNPPFTLLGVPGQTLEQTRADLRRQFGTDFVDLQPHRPKSAAPDAPRDAISTGALPRHGGKP